MFFSSSDNFTSQSCGDTTKNTKFIW